MEYEGTAAHFWQLLMAAQNTIRRLFCDQVAAQRTETGADDIGSAFCCRACGLRPSVPFATVKYYRFANKILRAQIFPSRLPHLGKQSGWTTII